MLHITSNKVLQILCLKWIEMYQPDWPDPKASNKLKEEGEKQGVVIDLYLCIVLSHNILLFKPIIYANIPCITMFLNLCSKNEIIKHYKIHWGPCIIYVAFYPNISE